MDNVNFELALSELGEPTVLTEGVFDDASSFLSGLLSASPEEAKKTMANSQRKAAEGEAALRKSGVDVLKCRKIAEVEARRVAVKFKKGASAEELSEEVQKSLGRVFSTLYDDILYGTEAKRAEEWSAGLAIFLVVLVVNTFAFSLLAILFGSVMAPTSAGLAAMTVGSSVIAPLTEESARRYAIRSGKGLSAFTAILNGWEFFNYVTRGVAAGISLGRMVALRAFVAVGHQFLGALQKWGYLKDVAGGVSEDKAGEVEYYTAIVIHAVWNVTGVLFGNLLLGIKPPTAPVAETAGSTVDGLESNLTELTTKNEAGELVLSEGLGSFLKSLASGDLEEQIQDIAKDVKDVHTPEQQRMVLTKIVRLLEKLTQLRHGGSTVTHYVHDSIGWFQKTLGTENAPKELNTRLGEAIAELARLRDKLLARKWDNDDANRQAEELRRKAEEILNSARQARDGDM